MDSCRSESGTRSVDKTTLHPVGHREKPVAEGGIASLPAVQSRIARAAVGLPRGALATPVDVGKPRTPQLPTAS